jgi:serine protease inhibitor
MMPACAAESGPNGNTSVPSAIDDFGFRLLATLSDGAHENVIVSPLSVSVALAMTYNGAAGDTKTGMAAALGLSSLDDDAINRGNHELLAALAKADPAVQIAIANALWAQAGFTIEKSFLDLNRNFYGAKVESLDFASNPAAAADVINRWVNQNTKGKIPTIIGVPESNTRLTLTNAVYFKGKWASPFDPKKTQPRTFHLAGGASGQAPTMVQEGKYPYFETTSLQAIRLAYGNGRYEMYVFLPRDGEGLSAFVKSLNQTRWNEWRGQFLQRKGKIELPRFESRWGKQLNPALKAMGMATAFDPNHADFSRIHTPPPTLFISDVEHKTYVKVDEEGTEAAAATSVTMSATSAMMQEPPPFEMIVDHPFFFAIAEQQSGAILFAGIMIDPTKS